MHCVLQDPVCVVPALLQHHLAQVALVAGGVALVRYYLVHAAVRSCAHLVEDAAQHLPHAVILQGEEGGVAQQEPRHAPRAAARCVAQQDEERELLHYYIQLLYYSQHLCTCWILL